MTEIVLLGPSHDRGSFDSGEPSLDDWLKRRATQAGRNDSARTYVLCDSDDRVLAYYAICTFSVDAADAPLRERVGRFAIPSILLARLAVDRQHQGRGLGGDLLIDALERAVRVSDEVAAKLFVLHALHEQAGGFYLKYGFTPLDEATPLTLYRPIKDVRASLEAT